MTAKMTLPEKFFEQAASKPEGQAFYYCRSRDQRWVSMTWNRYREEVTNFAGWLQNQGVSKGTKVALLAANRPEWVIADLAILSLGAISIPVYATSSEQDVLYIMEHSEAEFLCVDSLDRVPYLNDFKGKAIVTFDKALKRQIEAFTAPIHPFATIVQDQSFAIKKPTPVEADDIATIIYTSGTTGRPKGVVHTHGTIAEAMLVSQKVLENPEGKPDRFFSFLPLSHVAERMLVEVGSISTGSEIAFARGVDTLGDDLQRCRPTILLCVPRLWEKIYEKIHAGLIAASPVKKTVFFVAETLGKQRIHGQHILRNGSVAAKLSDALVGNKLRTKLGLDRARMLVTGAAPTRPEVVRFFGSFGMLLREVYGLTENLCLGVQNDNDDIVIGSCGKAFQGNEVKIADDGEILFRAPWMFKGYYKDPQATASVLSADGWFATGDLGKLDSDDRLSIVGRKKEILKTSNGKYVAPTHIEDRFKEFPVIKDAMIVGDNRKYCVALISLDPENPAHADMSKEELKKILKKVNEPLASFESIKRVGIMKEGFSIENGALTPTLKLKRNVVTSNKEDFINSLYHSEEAVVYEV